MSRLVAVTVRSLYLFFGLVGLAAAQDPPALEPPSLESPRVGASQSSQPEAGPKPDSGPKAGSPVPNSTARPAPVRPETRPMLAIPGITAPGSRPPTMVPPQVPRPPRAGTSPFALSPDALPLPSEYAPVRSTSRGAGVPLDEPPLPPSLDPLAPRSDFSTPGRPSNEVYRRSPRASTSRPSGETIPLTIEPLDGDSPIERSPSGRPATPRSTNGRAPSGSSTARPDDEPTDPRPAPRRAPGILGRLFGPPPPPPPPSREEPRSESKTKPDPDSDSGLDADVIARRRIERQIRATLGDKVRSYEVRITGRNVVIVAQPSRFWLRRSVRHSLESLPALQGYRARIEIRE
jgi:hypothetical protein